MLETNHLTAGVEAVSSKSTNAIFVGDGKQTIGLVENATIGSYLVIWKDQTKQQLPLAITSDGIQLPQEKGDNNYRFISWNDLYNLVQRPR